MTIYIPVVPIFWVLLAYVFIGLAMTFVLVKWQSRFIHNRQNRSMWEGVRPYRAFGISALFWPLSLFFTAKTEIEYRKRGYL